MKKVLANVAIVLVTTALMLAIGELVVQILFADKIVLYLTI